MNRAFCFLLACLLVPGCAPLWKSIPTDQRSVDKAELVGKIVKVTDPNGYFHKFMVHEINYPYLITTGTNPGESRYEVSIEKAILLQTHTRDPAQQRRRKKQIRNVTIIYAVGMGLLLWAFVSDLKKNGVGIPPGTFGTKGKN